MMCILCAKGSNDPAFTTIAAPIVLMAKDKATQATFLHGSTLLALADAFDTRACRALRRESFKLLVKVSAGFVAEFKSACDDNGVEHLTVALQCKSLFFELFRRARDLLGIVPDATIDDVQWTLERAEYLAKALVNLACVARANDFDFQERTRGAYRPAGLATDLCEFQMECRASKSRLRS